MNANNASILTAERRRMQHLAAGVPPGRWIVLPADAEAAQAVLAASSGTSPVLAVTGPNPLPALRRVQGAGLRLRIHLLAGDAVVAAAGWRLPVGLLVLPAAGRLVRPLLAAWGRHVSAGGHVLFTGGLVPPPDALGLRPQWWQAHGRGEGVFLLTRRPFG